MDYLAQTKDRWRFRLPHWEVSGRTHFVTIRCEGSLPAAARARVREIRDALDAVAAGSPEFSALQRKYFLICERYLDAGHGFCPFRDTKVCEMAVEALAEFPVRHRWRVEAATLMPNHVHLLIVPGLDARPLKEAIRGWKWHVAREANRILGRSGEFWQSDWFDRWARTESEEARMKNYIRENPVTAGIVAVAEEYRWTLVGDGPVKEEERGT